MQRATGFGRECRGDSSLAFHLRARNPGHPPETTAKSGGGIPDTRNPGHPSNLRKPGRNLAKSVAKFGTSIKSPFSYNQPRHLPMARS